MLRVLDMKYNIFSILTQVLGRFFKDRDPDFWPIRIRTQKKKADPDLDPGKIPGSETLAAKLCEPVLYSQVTLLICVQHNYQ